VDHQEQKMTKSTTTERPLLINSSELSRRLGIGRKTLHNMAQRGELPSPLVLGDGRWWDRRAVEQALVKLGLSEE
jgi:predicted DNA-binding transcriptional regulator AlpA